jgi:hypothetical protein
VHRTSAAVVTWEFAGQITSVYDENDLLGGQVSVGSPFSGSFAFETTAPDLAADDAYVGIYGGLNAFLAHVDQVAVLGVIVPGSGITVRNASPGVVSDGFGLRLPGELLGEPVVIDLTFTDESGTVFDSAALPVAPLDLAAFDRATFSVWSAEELRPLRLEGDITSLVPEPGTLLFVSAGAVVAFLRRRKRRYSMNGRCTGGQA